MWLAAGSLAARGRLCPPGRGGLCTAASRPRLQLAAHIPDTPG